MALFRIHRLFSTHMLTREDPLSAWRRFLAWQVRSRFSKTVVVEWIAGAKFVAHRGMTGFTGNIYAGLHEAVDMLFLLHFLRPGDLFADVGANVGSYTVLASKVVGAKTVAFEPDVDAARKLQKNILINGIAPLVAVHEVAIGAEDGEILFTTGMDTMNCVAASGHPQARIVPMARLDSLLGSAPPIMVKLDVEGFEEQALTGAVELLAKPSLQVVALETVSPQIMEIMALAGLMPIYYSPVNRSVSRMPGRDPASNQLFARDPEFVAARVNASPRVHVLGKSV